MQSAIRFVPQKLTSDKSAFAHRRTRPVRNASVAPNGCSQPSGIKLLLQLFDLAAAIYDDGHLFAVYDRFERLNFPGPIFSDLRIARGFEPG
jgi:hypothetical protein